MATVRSWFPASAPKKRRSSRSSHELPRWRTPSPMAASMIPPPIVQSTLALPSEMPVESVLIDKSSPHRDREHELEADLQFLLDAQAEGLIRGLEGGVPNGKGSTGSTTPTISSTKNRSTGQFRKTISQRPGLRSARKGIYSSVIALSALRDDELQELDVELHRSEQTLDQLESWEARKQGLQEVTQGFDSSEETTRVQRLKQEADSVQAEINKAELRLMELKTKHRRLLRQAAAVENSVQAKLASYTSSLRMLEEDVQRFLSLEPEASHSHPSSADGRQSVWQLPPKRRNIEMAKEFWTARRVDISRQREAVESEKTALLEGAGLWKDAVMEVTDFEKRLRGEVSVLSPSSSQSNFAWDEPPQTDAGSRMKELLDKMATVIGSLEAKYQHAEAQNWRLLIAAIGAELDALRRGRRILEGVMGVATESHGDANGIKLVDPLPDPGHEIHELDKSFETARRPSLTRHLSSVSDDPDPELMFSRQGHDLE